MKRTAHWRPKAAASATRPLHAAEISRKLFGSKSGENHMDQPWHGANRTARTVLPLIGALCLFACDRQPAATPASTNENAPSDPKDALPEWSLTESDSASLAVPFEMSQFEIRPPENFRFIKHIAELNTYYWIGPVRDDETYPQLMVTITQLSDHESSAPLTSLLDGIIASLRQRRENWSQTRVEHGKINGLPFVRTSWSGIATDDAREGLSGHTMHGIVYLTVDDAQAIQIMCQDVDPYQAESLKDGHAAALSFRVLRP